MNLTIMKRLSFVILVCVGCLVACQRTSDSTSETLIATAFSAAKSATAPGSAAQMTQSAVAFLDALSPQTRVTAVFDIDDEHARTNWSNLPAAMVERSGLRVGDLSAAERQLLHNLIRASTSSQGYQKIAGIMWLDDILRDASRERLAERSGDDRFARLVESWSSENYWVSFFGDPSVDTRWAWLITGHHLAVSFTVVDDRVAFTPAFMGAEPYEVIEGPLAGWRALSHEVERGFELMQSFDADQRAQAVLSEDIPRDVLEGPGRKASLKEYRGITAGQLDPQQRTLLLHIVQEYVRNADHDTADRQFKQVEADGVDSLFFAWIGPTDDISQRFYYRVHGPSILIEYVRERGVGGDRSAANHIHTMVRDPKNDYGEDWLETHYREHHAGGRRR